MPIAISAYDSTALSNLQADQLSGIQYATPNLYLDQGDAGFMEEGFAETDRGWEFSINDRLLFASDESTVLPQQAGSIKRIAGRLLAVDIRHATVEGHADGSGSAEHNQRLSERRAAAVAEVLVGSGFDKTAISTTGLGDRFPIESNATAEGRRENRRVVILITAP
ncbi:OmpA family protein [Sphingomonas koreensis]|nr:OmpA family protein [Sphingomonas koreensis]